MTMLTQLLAGSWVKESTAADNATSTVTIAATPGSQHVLTGVHVTYSVAVAAKKVFTLTYVKPGAITTSTYVVELDYNLSRAQSYAFPGVIRCEVETEVSIALAASGTGGTTGKVAALGFSE